MCNICDHLSFFQLLFRPISLFSLFFLFFAFSLYVPSLSPSRFFLSLLNFVTVVRHPMGHSPCDSLHANVTSCQPQRKTGVSGEGGKKQYAEKEGERRKQKEGERGREEEEEERRFASIVTQRQHLQVENYSQRVTWLLTLLLFSLSLSFLCVSTTLIHTLLFSEKQQRKRMNQKVRKNRGEESERKRATHSHNHHHTTQTGKLFV